MPEAPSLSKKRKTMKTPSSPPSLCPSQKHLQARRPMFKPRRTEIARIHDQRKLCTTFCKRRRTVFKKTFELCTLTGARAAVIVFYNEGKCFAFGSDKVEDIISDYVRLEGLMMWPEGMREWVEWAEKECDSFSTEDLKSLVEKCKAVFDRASKKLKDVGAGGVYWESEGLDDKIESGIKSSKYKFPVINDYGGDGDHSSQVNAAAGSGSSGALYAPESGAYNAASGERQNVETILALPDLEYNPDGFRYLSVEKRKAVVDRASKKLKDAGAGGDTPRGVCWESEGLNVEEIESLRESLRDIFPHLNPEDLFAPSDAVIKDYGGDGDHSSQVNAAAGSGSSGALYAPESCAYNAASGQRLGVESFPTWSDLLNNPDVFLNFSEDCRRGHENLVIGGESSRKEPTVDVDSTALGCLKI